VTTCAAPRNIRLSCIACPLPSCRASMCRNCESHVRVSSRIIDAIVQQTRERCEVIVHARRAKQSRGNAQKSHNLPRMKLCLGAKIIHVTWSPPSLSLSLSLSFSLCLFVACSEIIWHLTHDSPGAVSLARCALLLTFIAVGVFRIFNKTVILFFITRLAVIARGGF